MIVFPVVAIVTGFTVQLPFGGVAAQEAIATASELTLVRADVGGVAVPVIAALDPREDEAVSTERELAVIGAGVVVQEVPVVAGLGARSEEAVPT